jgi:aspartate racemase
LREKIIGILGGMGPEATADLYMRIIRATPVKKDQEHIRVIIDSNSKIPDRTPAIVGTGKNPLPVMLETGRNLQRAGADFLIMPCNTAHYFHKELSEGLDIPVLHMINLSAQKAAEQYPNIRKAGLLASDGTIVSRLYHDSYGEKEIKILTPEPESQKLVMDAIYAHIKTGNLVDGEKLLRKVSEELIEEGAELILCGCTEVSIVLKDGDLTVPVLDPLQVLAEAAVRYAYAST